MHWFLIALCGPILFACANHIDKYVIERYIQHGVVGALVLFSALFSLVGVVVAGLIHPEVFSLSLVQVGLLMGNGVLIMLALLCYFYALNHDEASYVVPWYQTIPIFAGILAYVVLGETVSPLQMLASGIIIVGAGILSIDLTGARLRFKGVVVGLMLTASLIYALSSVVFKFVALDIGFWPSTFWDYAGRFLFGVVLFASLPSYRKEFFLLLRNNRVGVLTLSGISELIFLLAESIMAYATLLAPVVLVLLVNAFQPMFVLLLGLALTYLVPNLVRESVNARQLTQKLLGVLLVAAGSYFIG